MPIRVLLVDDHVVLREGLKVLLNSENDIHVIGEASNGREAIAVVDQLQPDVIVSDISMPGLNGIESVRVIRQQHSEPKIIILSMHANQAYVTQALQAGANAYVVKQADANELVTAIRAVIEQGSYLSPVIAQGVVDDYLNVDPNEIGPNLTTREREVTQLIAEGLSTRDISEKLFISVKTVETHRTNIMRKLDTKSQADIVKYAIKKGWVNLE